MPRKPGAYEDLPPGEGVGQALKSALDGGAPDPSNMSNEERCVYVLRRGTRNNNHTYMCKSCGKQFTGNRQKIRIHLTGISEGSTFIQKCPRPFTEHFQYCMDLQQKIRGADALKKTLPVSTTKGMEDVPTNVASHGGNSAGDNASKSAQVDNSRRRAAAAAGCSSGVHAFYSAWASAVKAAGGEQPASVEAAETTSSNSGLPGRVSAIFAKRKDDVCSEAALAASAVNPQHVLAPQNPWTGKPQDSSWAPRGAQQALRRVLGKVLGPGAVSAALSEHRKFLLGDDGFSDTALQELGKEDSAEAYWFEVKREGIAPILAPVALKLCTAYSGQGGAERANRDVTFQKSKLQPRQAAATTEARLAIKYALRVRNSKGKTEASKDGATKPTSLIDILAENLRRARNDAWIVSCTTENDASDDERDGGEYDANRWLVDIHNVEDDEDCDLHSRSTCFV
ncbi:hypothetical protein RI054_13g66780 [Pseudoscourfieldia marina]